MNSKLRSSVLYGALAFALPISAYAQSKVTLYGILDEGVVYQNNTGGATGGKKVSLDSLAGINGSRWGLTGSEDLGAGLRAIFTLESGQNINNGTFGQGGTEFGRQAYVGLSSERFGSLTMGRQYDMVGYFITPNSETGIAGTAAFSHPGDLDNTFASLRLNNSIRYMSPNLRGLTFGAVYGLGGVAGNLTANSGYSVGGQYSNGPLILDAAFTYFKNPTSTVAGSGFFTNNANGASILAQSLNKAYSTASAYQVGILGAGYTIGPVLFLTTFSNTQYANLGSAFSGGTARFNNVEATAQFKYSPSLVFTTTYDYLVGKGVATAEGKEVGAQHYNQISAEADYFLSKRTDVYVAAAWQKASGTSSTGAPAVADFVNQGDSSNNHQIYARVGLRHKF